MVGTWILVRFWKGLWLWPPGFLMVLRVVGFCENLVKSYMLGLLLLKKGGVWASNLTRCFRFDVFVFFGNDFFVCFWHLHIRGTLLPMRCKTHWEKIWPWVKNPKYPFQGLKLPTYCSGFESLRVPWIWRTAKRSVSFTSLAVSAVSLFGCRPGSWGNVSSKSILWLSVRGWRLYTRTVPSEGL